MKLKWTDEQVYQDEIKWYESSDIGPDGEVYSTRNPNSYWDWYQLGGRWTGFFKLKEGKTGKIGSPGIMTEVPKSGEVDQALKSDIDFESIRKAAYDRGVSEYESVAKYFESGEIPKIEKTWDELLKDTSIKAIEKKREIYHSQPALIKVKEVLEKLKVEIGNEIHNQPIGSFYFKIDDFQCTKEEYAQACADNSITTFAVIKDGKWFARGKMGWWASVSDKKEFGVWEKEFNSLIDSLPEDTLLSVYDCHI